MIKNISVIGSGTMGNGIAHCFAQHGFKVNLIDISKENLKKAKITITKNIDRMVSKEIITTENKIQILGRIHYYVGLVKEINNSDLIIEAATESKKIKFEIFKKLDQICHPNTILATNTSSISITEIAKSTRRPEKVIGMHFMNPVPIMKLVEVIQCSITNQQTTDFIMNTAKQLNKCPVLVNDAPGFVANRILLPMINEAILTLEDGVSGVNEIDTVMKLGMSHPMGPLELADFIGLDVCLSILNILYEGFEDEKYKASQLLIELVKNNELGVKSKRGFYNYENGVKKKMISNRFK